MVIRPMAAAYALGEIGRSAGTLGAKGGPTSFSKMGKDEVTLSGKPRPGAGLYSGSPLFKIMGSVELIRGDFEAETEYSEAAL